MNEPEHEESAVAGAVEIPPETVETPPLPAFPWPPRPGESAHSAFLDTIEQSVRAPAEFFRAMPPGGYRTALSFFIPVGVIAAGVELFWSNIFELLGYHPFGAVWSVTPVDRLTDFLLSPLALIATLFVVAAIVHVSIKIIADGHARFVTTTRVCAFSCAPQLLVAIPVVGPLAATIGTLVLLAIGLQEAHHTTTLRATAALLLPFVLFVFLALITLLLIVLGGFVQLLTRMQL